MDKISGTKNALYFLWEAPTCYSFTFNLQFLYGLKHKVRLCKTFCRIFYFPFHFLFIKVYIFVQQDAESISLTLKRHNSFQNENNRKATHSFAPRPLIFNLQQVWKFNDICVSWSFQRIKLGINFLNLENRSFENVNFCQ